MESSGTDGAVNVMFTSAGRRVELLRAFKAAYCKLGLPGRVVATDIDPLAPALSVADAQYIVPKTNDPSYVDVLLRLCHEEHVRLLFPLTDWDIPVLAPRRADFTSEGVCLGVVAADAAEIARDKSRTAEFFRQIGLPTAASWLPSEVDPDRMSYPVFLKPRSGSGGKHAFKASNVDELQFFLRYVPDPIVQECLAGPEITTDVACGFDGRVLAAVSRRRIEVRNGEVAKGVTVVDEEIRSGCIKIANALRAVGPITVQCMFKDGKPHFTEINARFGGGVPLAIAAGMNFPEWYLASAAGRPFVVPDGYATGVYLTRFDDSFFLRGDGETPLESGSFRS